MKLTCVTAVFNAVKSGNRENLIRCVKSVASLKTEHEHLIYDGASTDGTVELLRELETETPGLKVVSEKDSGIYNALNKGVRDARGEWFYVLGCDDYVEHPEIMDRLISEELESTQVIATTVKMVSADGKIQNYFTSIRQLYGLFLWCVCNHQGEIARTSLIRNLSGFNEKYRISADTNMFFLARLHHAKFHYVFEQFAVFSHGGTADSNVASFTKEDRGFVSEALSLTNRQKERFERYAVLPLHIVAKYLYDVDDALRISSRFMCARWIKHWLRLIFLPIVVVTRPLRNLMK